MSAIPSTASPAPPVDHTARIAISLRVNGQDHPILAEPRRTLLDALRHDLALTETMKVCDMGNCGACTVIVDGQAMYACLLLAVDCDGREITTIEGIANGNELAPLQQAFIEHDAFQCGFCTPGQIVNLQAFLDQHDEPTDQQIEHAEALLTGAAPDRALFERVAGAVLADAVPLAKNGSKVPLAKALVIRALMAASTPTNVSA